MKITRKYLFVLIPFYVNNRQHNSEDVVCVYYFVIQRRRINNKDKFSLNLNRFRTVEISDQIRERSF